MTYTKHGVLQVPGARLYYEMRGSGPVLLMIHGGNGDADSYPIADLLSDRYTVVTYDRRGHSRSRLEDPTENYRVSAHSDDAHRLLASLTDEPAYVFGCSSGAVIGLDLAIHHPEQIRMMVAHEPPIPQLLTGSDHTKGVKSLEDLEQQYKRSGLSALETFAAAMGITSSAQPERPPERTDQLMANIDYFILSEVPGLREYRPDIGRLKASSIAVTPAGGIDSQGFLPYRYAEALADHLGTGVVDFPGNHVGCVLYPREFAEKLDEVFRNKTTKIPRV
ncbi:alpha/beta hydrolase [Bacillus swezeyi]|uniref:alpha/beta fold hydrolase n=1 Tax=Bacillus swezeyi TaxID=1925020 RepID=UPI002E1B352F|nr:alpha/beta hydrolase [Bacillus swezeyi]